jgi:hypothetical protein
MNIKDIKEDIKNRINNIQEIIDHQDLVKRITKGKGRTYEDSYAYKLGLQMGQAHLQILLEKIEKNEFTKSKI